MTRENSFRSRLERILGGTPWWLVSAGLHAVLLLGAAALSLERVFAIDLPPIVVSFHPEAPKSPERRPPVEEEPGSELEAPVVEPERPMLDQPVHWFPGAREADRDESRDGLETHTLRGERPELEGYLEGRKEGLDGRAGRSPGVSGLVGVGAGTGYSGRKGRPGAGGKEDLLKKGGGNPTTEKGVRAALLWLARHQSADGSWSGAGFSHRCAQGRCSGPGEADYDAGITSLSLLAFLGAGYSQLSHELKEDSVAPAQKFDYGETVKKGLQWLVFHQDPEGCVGERGPKYLYNHAIAALALSEAFGMTSAPILREPAQRAIDFLVAAQNPGKGWRYAARGGDNDTSVTGWAVMALKSAELSGLALPPAAFAGALSWITDVTDTSGYYRAGYNAPGTGKVYVPGKNETWDDHPSMSAVAVLSRIFIAKRRDPALGAVNLLAADLPAWKEGKIDFYYWYYGSLAMFQYDGPSGPFWTRWNEPMKKALVPSQKTAQTGCEHGSWDPAADRWGFEGGRVYATAINCLTLEVYYRYAHVFGTASK